MKDVEVPRVALLEAAADIDCRRAATLEAAERLVDLVKWWGCEDYGDAHETIFQLEFVTELRNIVDAAEISRSYVVGCLDPSDVPPF